MLEATPTACVPVLSELVALSAGWLDALNRSIGFIDLLFHRGEK